MNRSSPRNFTPSGWKSPLAMRCQRNSAGAAAMTPSTRQISPFQVATTTAFPSGVKSKPPGRIQLFHGFSTGRGNVSAMNAPSVFPGTDVVATSCAQRVGPPWVSGPRSSGAEPAFATAASDAGSARDTKIRVFASDGSSATQKPPSLRSTPSPESAAPTVSGATRSSRGFFAAPTFKVRMNTGSGPSAAQPGDSSTRTPPTVAAMTTLPPCR